jgi:hypothetical protein
MGNEEEEMTEMETLLDEVRGIHTTLIFLVFLTLLMVAFYLFVVFKLTGF